MVVLELLTLQVAKGQSLHVIFFKKTEHKPGDLGRKAGWGHSAKRTCGSLLSILWFRVLNLRR
jgi:hypothetical protein